MGPICADGPWRRRPILALDATLAKKCLQTITRSRGFISASLLIEIVYNCDAARIKQAA